MGGHVFTRIEKVDYSVEGVPIGEFENVLFSGCNFGRTDLSGVVFWECVFEDCDLSLTTVTDASFHDVRFVGCKMLGFRFDMCNKLGLELAFERCNLNHSVFSGLKLPNTVFTDCTLCEVDFESCDLTRASFSGSDMTRSVFVQSNLKKADFRTAHGFSIDPESNTIQGAKFSMAGLAGLLDKYKLDIS